MSTRSNIRPRPVDINRQLVTVKDESELDSLDLQAAELGAQAGHGHGHGHNSSNNAKKPKAIPIPDIREVETHYRDYLPLFSAPLTYLHGKGVGGAREPEPVEYDLDNEDEDWLKTYNLGRSKLNDLLFEKMLWKLELACAAATDSALTAAGAGPSERSAANAVAPIDHLPKPEAIRMLALECGGREKLLNDVYGYWASKRKRWQKPIMRRLQAPTPASDTNPYNTFRTREKINRPQTRRRRDNSDELLDKMRLLKDNLAHSRQILDEVVRRERRKRDLACTEIELMRIQWRHHHEGARLSFDHISQEGLQLLRERIRLNGHQDSIRGGTRVLANKTQMAPSMPHPKRVRREGVLRYLRHQVAQMMAPPPAVVEPETLWSMPTNLLQIPLESKEKQRDRMDDIRRGRPVQPPSAAAAGSAGPAGAPAASAAAAAVKTEPGSSSAGGAAAAAGEGGAGAAAAAAAGAAAEGAKAPETAAAAAGVAGASANGAAEGPDGKATSPTGQAAGADAAAKQQQAAAAAGGQQQQQPGAPPGSGLPPSGAASAHKMNAVMVALHDREHLYKLPDTIANSIQNWRCFIGRGGRARLECIDHVTHETFTAVKAEAQVVAHHYQTTPWPPMPTAPNLREIVERSRPAPRANMMSRAGSLASQPSAGSTMLANSSSMGPSAAHRQRYMQQQYPNPQMAAAAAAAATAAGGGMPSVQSLQQQPQPQHVVQQAQQAHRAGMQAQQAAGAGGDFQQQQQQAAMQQQTSGGFPAGAPQVKRESGQGAG